MAIRMRFLHYPDKPKLAAFCKELTSEYENCKFDRIPPAYPSERERFTVIFIKCGKELTSELDMFCRGLTKDRSQNVLYFVEAPDSAIEKILELTKAAGANVIGEPIKIKFPGSLPIIGGNFTEETKATVRDAVKKAYDELNS